MTDLIATKSMSYATRRLVAGDPFTARTGSDARALIALGKARPGDRAETPNTKPADLAALREKYVTVIGKRPYHGWDAATLEAKIAEAGKA